MSTSHVDFLVVGARVAGAATALLLARMGHSVMLVDRGRFGADTLSTHALMRGAVLQLSRWGLLERLLERDTPVLRRTSFHYGDEEVVIEIEPTDRVPGLVAPRRTVLDPVLVEAAVEAGVEVHFGRRVSDLIRSGDRVVGAALQDRSGPVRTVHARWVIGADGAGSTVARLVEAPFLVEGEHASRVVYGYFDGFERHHNHWYFRPGLGAGIIPTNEGLACVFVATPADRLPEGDASREIARLLHRASPEAARRLGHPATPHYRFRGRTGFVRQCVGDGWALVGDASHFKDPLTAHGITDALRDAELLAHAVHRDDPEAYPAARDRFAPEMLRLSDRVAAFDWSMEVLQTRHRELARHMKREVQMIERWAIEPVAGAIQRTRHARARRGGGRSARRPPGTRP